jgi:hypothetical protein
MGRAIAQVVSRWLPAIVAQVKARVRPCGIRGGQSGTGAGFLPVLRFPLPILIPPIAPQSSSSSSIIWGWYSRPNNGQSTKWTVSSHEENKKSISKEEGYPRKSKKNEGRVNKKANLATLLKKSSEKHTKILKERYLPGRN